METLIESKRLEEEKMERKGGTKWMNVSLCGWCHYCYYGGGAERQRFTHMVDTHTHWGCGLTGRQTHIDKPVTREQHLPYLQTSFLPVQFNLHFPAPSVPLHPLIPPHAPQGILLFYSARKRIDCLSLVIHPWVPLGNFFHVYSKILLSFNIFTEGCILETS